MKQYILNTAINWFESNHTMLNNIMDNLIFYPPSADRNNNSLAYEMENKDYIISIIIWESGDVKIMYLNKKTTKESIKNIIIEQEEDLINQLNNFLSEIKNINTLTKNE